MTTGLRLVVFEWVPGGKGAARYQGLRGVMGSVVGMRERGCASLGERRALAVCLLLQCAGWGLFQSSLYGGSFFTNLLDASGVSWVDGRMCSLWLVAGTGVACIANRSLTRRGVDMTAPRVIAACYAGAFALLVAGTFFPFDGALASVVSFALGLFVAAPLLVWFKSFLGVYTQAGPLWCIASIACGNLFAMIIGPLVGLTTVSRVAALVVALVGAVGSLLCQGGLERCGAHEADRAMRPGTYRLTTYAATVVTSFGVTWGLSNGALGALSAPALAVGPEWLFWIGGMVGAAFIVLYVLVMRRVGSLRFGLFIRLSLTFSGLACACVPVLSTQAPAILPVVFRAVVVVQGAAMTFFSVEICHEKRLGIVEVMPLNYILFVVAGCIAMDLPLVLGDCGLDGLFLWSVLALVAVAATILVIPALPSSTSTAATFTLRELPENESFEARAAHARDGLVEKYGLSAREAEVLGLLVQGLNRNQIAERLALSSWTVKDHLTSIYAKTGVHSAKELLVLVAGGERGGAEREARG